MKKSNLFDTPSRQSQWAIVFIIIRFLRKLLSQLWPILIAFFLGKSSSFDRYEMLFSGLGLFGMITSVVAYFRYYFYVSEDELVIRSGLFKKVKLNIPYERIQSINFKQTILHRLFQVTELEIETAGSDSLETRLDALTLEKAEALRSLLLEKREAAISLSQNIELIIDENIDTEKSTILELSFKQLVKIGLTQNHFKLVGITIGFLFSVFIYGFTFDVEFKDVLQYITNLHLEISIGQKLLLGLLILTLSVLFSIIIVILRYYKLHFWRHGNKFQIVQGLFTRREVAALDSKIQMLHWGQNPLERWIGFYNILFRQASSGGRSKQSLHFQIPGCEETQVDYVKQQWLGKKMESTFETEGISKHFFWRGLKYRSIFFGILILVAAYLAEWFAIPMLVLLAVIAIYFKWLKYIKTLYGYNNNELYIGGGILGIKHTLLPAYKIQNLTIEQTPYEWRRNLASLKIDTAAGKVIIPFMAYDKALKLLDLLIYRVEKTQKGWM
ncbi:MAG: putative membrane protein [Saprospiraceae bacterium]|jgi:putative membrane protein